MQAFPEFRHMPMSFWAMIKYVSETLGYTARRQGIVRTYSIDEIDELLSQNGIVVDYKSKTQEQYDILINGSKIVRIAKQIAEEVARKSKEAFYAKIKEKKRDAVKVGIYDVNENEIAEMPIESDEGVDSSLRVGQIIPINY